MISPDVVLKLIGSFTIFVLSLVGYVIPLNISRIQYLRYYTSDSNWMDCSFYHNLKSFSSGVILGVAMLHLIAEAIESLEGLSQYPVAILLASVGLLFSICVDQLAMHYMTSGNDRRNTSTISEASGEKNMSSASAFEGDALDSEELHSLTRFEIEGPPAAPKPPTQDSPVAKLYILEAAIAVHSVIIGFGFGVLDPIETMKKAAVLITAFSFHQFFEGIGLSTTIMSMLKHRQDRNLTVAFGLIFSLTFPFGSFVGILNVSDTYESLILQGCANAFAGGVLLHTALLEMIAADFANQNLIARPVLKGCMLVCLVLGFILMAMLAAME